MRKVASFMVNSIAAIAIALVIFVTLVNIGVIGRPASEDISVDR